MAVLKLDADVDSEAIRKEAFTHIETMSADERADMPDELKEAIQHWKDSQTGE